MVVMDDRYFYPTAALLAYGANPNITDASGKYIYIYDNYSSYDNTIIPTSNSNSDHSNASNTNS